MRVSLNVYKIAAKMPSGKKKVKCNWNVDVTLYVEMANSAKTKYGSPKLLMCKLY